MASLVHIARDNEKARKQLAESMPIIAANLGLEVPNINIHKKYSLEYRRAKQMLAISDFFLEIANSMQSTPTRRTRKAKS